MKFLRGTQPDKYAHVEDLNTLMCPDIERSLEEQGGTEAYQEYINSYLIELSRISRQDTATRVAKTAEYAYGTNEECRFAATAGIYALCYYECFPNPTLEELNIRLQALYEAHKQRIEILDRFEAPYYMEPVTFGVELEIPGIYLVKPEIYSDPVVIQSKKIQNASVIEAIKAKGFRFTESVSRISGWDAERTSAEFGKFLELKSQYTRDIELLVLEIMFLNMLGYCDFRKMPIEKEGNIYIVGVHMTTGGLTYDDPKYTPVGPVLKSNIGNVQLLTLANEATALASPYIVDPKHRILESSDRNGNFIKQRTQGQDRGQRLVDNELGIQFRSFRAFDLDSFIEYLRNFAALSLTARAYQQFEIPGVVRNFLDAVSNDPSSSSMETNKMKSLVRKYSRDVLELRLILQWLEYRQHVSQIFQKTGIGNPSSGSREEFSKVKSALYTRIGHSCTNYVGFKLGAEESMMAGPITLQEQEYPNFIAAMREITRNARNGIYELVE